MDNNNNIILGNTNSNVDCFKIPEATDIPGAPMAPTGEESIVNSVPETNVQGTTTNQSVVSQPSTNLNSNVVPETTAIPTTEIQENNNVSEVATIQTNQINEMVERYNQQDILSNGNLKIHSMYKRNLLIVFFVTLVPYLLYYLVDFLLIKKFNSDSFLTFIIVFGLIAFYNMCYAGILEKAGFKWWAMLIPVYNVYTLIKFTFGSGVWFFIMIGLPILSIFPVRIAKLLSLLVYLYPIIINFSIGRKFRMSGIMTVLFAFIRIPMFALSKKY